MKIELRKISKTPLDFDVKSDKIAFKGFLQYDSNRLILLRASLVGSLDMVCDICGSDFVLELDEGVEFFISDGIYKSNQDEFLDVVEIFNSFVDLDEILNSELESIKSDYHICQNCKNVSEDFQFTIE